MTPEEFTVIVSAWITAWTAIIELVIMKLGLLVAAAFALYLSVRTKDVELKAQIQAIKERQDRHSVRLTEVALAVPPAAHEVQQVEVINTPEQPVQTQETDT